MERIIKLTKRNTRQYFDQYVGGMESRLNEFKRELIESKGLAEKEWDYSPKSLVPLWKWAYPQMGLEPVPIKEPLPMWFDVEFGGKTIDGKIYSHRTLWLADGLAYYLAKIIFENVPNTGWKICEDRRFFFYNKPLISGIPGDFSPIHFIIVLVSGVVNFSDKNSDTALFDLYNYWFGKK